jgi:hypothetical protein
MQKDGKTVYANAEGQTRLIELGWANIPQISENVQVPGAGSLVDVPTIPASGMPDGSPLDMVNAAVADVERTAQDLSSDAVPASSWSPAALPLTGDMLGVDADVPADESDDKRFLRVWGPLLGLSAALGIAWFTLTPKK